MRDSQRQRVYNAEDVPMEGHMTLKEIAAYCQTTGKKAKRDLYRSFPDLKITMKNKERIITVKDGRRRRSACFMASDMSIRMPRWSRNPQMALHELAHAYAHHLFSGHKRQAHGPEFVGIYLILIRHGIGVEKYQEVMSRFREGNVNWRS